MRKILEDFYFGSITPHDQRVAVNSDLQRLVKHTERFEPQLEEQLSEENRSILKKLMDAQAEIDNIVALENFILGVRMMAECMDANDGNLMEGSD